MCTKSKSLSSIMYTSVNQYYTICVLVKHSFTAWVVDYLVDNMLEDTRDTGGLFCTFKRDTKINWIVYEASL